MKDIRLPALLDSGMKEKERLHPTKESIKIQMKGVSEANITLAEGEEIPMHGMVSLYNHRGFLGIYRRTSGGQAIGQSRSYALKHGIDILQDSLWEDETTFEGTKAELMRQILSRQKHLIGGTAPWEMGSCADGGTIKKEIKYDNLLDLMMSLVEEGGEYYFTYDQTTFPWTVSLAERPSEVSAEFRLERNIDKCSIKDNDAELCTRLCLNVNIVQGSGGTSQNSSTYKTYDNAAAQAKYGIISKTQDIDVESEAKADAWAADFLRRRAEPQIQIEVDGYILAAKTGDSWDESRIGELVRVALKGYHEPIEERCVTVSYPDVYGAPETVKVSLANALPTFTGDVMGGSSGVASSISSLKKSSRGSKRAEKDFAKHFEITDENGNILRQAGLKLDANGMLVYANDNVNMVGSRFNVQADQIGMVVGTNDGTNYIKAGEIVLSINAQTQESAALINADHINISGTSTVQSLAGAMEKDASGNLVIKDGAGFRLRKTVDGATAEYGVWDEGNLTGGVIVDKVNGQTTTKIKGTKVVIGNDVDGTGLPDWINTEEGLVAQKATIVDLNAVAARVQTLETDSLMTVDLQAELAKLTHAVINNGLSVYGSLVAHDGILSTDYKYGNQDSLLNAYVSITDGTYADNSKTVTFTKANGDRSEITFSRATTLTGEYSGGNTWTVTASPQGNTDVIVLGTKDKNHVGIARPGGETWIGTFEHNQYNNGWTAAYGEVSLPTERNTNQSFNVKTPKATVDGGANTTNYMMNNSGKNVATVTNSAGTTVAQLEHNRYNGGWAAAYGKLSWPGAATAGTEVLSFVVQAPPETVDGNAASHTFTMSKGTPGTSGYASVNLNGVAVARIDISNWYTAGVTKGEENGETAWRPDSITQNTTRKTVTVLNAAGDSIGGPYSASDIWDAGNANRASRISGLTSTTDVASQSLSYGTKYKIISQYQKADGTWANGGTTVISVPTDRYQTGVTDGESHFSLADVTLEGDEDTDVYVKDSNGTAYYKAGAAEYKYSLGDVYHWTTAYARSGGIRLQHYGKATNITNQTQSRDWYYIISSGGDMYYKTESKDFLASGSGSNNVHLVGSGGWITPVSGGALNLSAATRYKKGTRYQSTYYTKNS